MAKYTVKYRTFDSLISGIRAEWRKDDADGFINPQDLISVAIKINKELGNRVAMVKEKVIPFTDGRVRLPDDFNVLDSAIVCGDFSYYEYPIQGTHTEEVYLDQPYPRYRPYPEQPAPCEKEVISQCPQCNDPCPAGPCSRCSKDEQSCKLDCNGNAYKVVQVVKRGVKTYTQFMPIRVSPNARLVDCNCPNLHVNSRYNAYISDGWIFMEGIKEGNLYIQYRGSMENSEGDLMVVDHGIINDYYEYAIKKKILETKVMNGETVNQAQLQLIHEEHRKARNNALSIASTPDFSEIEDAMRANRAYMNSRFFRIFK